MRPYIHSVRNGIHIIDLEKTKEKLLEALTFVRDIAASNGTILFVGTKRQAQAVVEKHSRAVAMPFVTHRWIGGTLTNFSVIQQLIRRLKNLKQQASSGELKKYTKKEQLDLHREIERLEEEVGGMQQMEQLPQALYVVDIKTERTAVREAQSKGIPVVALCDSNTNPTMVTHPIPANDDATKSIEFITNLIAKAIEEGKKHPKQPEPKPTEKKKEA